MRVSKILNNNLVLSRNENNEEIIVKGRGIGFHARKGDRIDESMIEKIFYPENHQNSVQIQEYLLSIPEEYFDFTQRFVDQIKEENPGLQLNNSIYLSLSDHIMGTFNRLRDGISLTYTCHPKDVFFAQQYCQIHNNIAGDVHVRGAYPGFAYRYFKEHDMKIEMLPEDAEILKNGTVDFVSISYYSSNCVSLTQENAETTKGNGTVNIKNPYLKASDWGWQIDALGLRYVLNQIYDRYQVPIMIVENGLGAVDQITEDGQIHDDYRIDYMRQHIEEMKEAVCDGVDLIGYTCWGCTDVVSASTGEVKKRYGLIFVDKYDDGTGDMSRKRKDSFFWYKKVIESNGEIL